MERRAFLQLLFVGAGAAAVTAAGPSRALTAIAPLPDAPRAPEPAPGAAVATEADLERAKVEKSWYYYRRGYYRPRRWRRRFWRRPRFWRRRVYYYY